MGLVSLVNREINGNRLGKKLCNCTTGQIYLAKGEDGQAWAVKIITEKHYLNQFLGRRKLYNYIKNMPPHANLLEINDFGQDINDGFGYIISPYMENGVLRDHDIKDISRILDINIQILRGVQELHKRKILHCDINPGNIFFDRDMNVKLGDYGLVRTLRKYQEVNQKKKRMHYARVPKDITDLGPIDYMNPKIYDVTQLRPESDNYCAGSVLFEMLTGELATNIVDKRPHLVRLGEDICDILYPVIEKSLEPIPSRAFSSAEEFSRALLEAKKRIEAIQKNPGKQAQETYGPKMTEEQLMFDRLKKEYVIAVQKMDNSLKIYENKEIPKDAQGIPEAAPLELLLHNNKRLEEFKNHRYLNSDIDINNKYLAMQKRLVPVLNKVYAEIKGFLEKNVEYDNDGNLFRKSFNKQQWKDRYRHMFLRYHSLIENIKKNSTDNILTYFQNKNPPLFKEK